MPEKKAALPTYSTIADVLEKKNGSGIRLLGWTFARTAMIAPPFLLVGVPAKKAFGGAFLASALISVFTIIRIYNAGYEEAFVKSLKQRRQGTVGGAKARRRLSR